MKLIYLCIITISLLYLQAENHMKEKPIDIQMKQIQTLIYQEMADDPRFSKIVRKNLLSNCTVYEDDYRIIMAFPFDVAVDLPNENDETTYVKTDQNENIYYLNIANEMFVPRAVFCLKNLKSLSVRNTPFYNNFQLPAEIELLAHSLNFLSLNNVSIVRLPKQIGQLTNLIRLEITNTGLASVPDDIGNLTSLEILNLSNNNITELPTTITNIRTLTELNLNNNFNLRTVQTLTGHRSLISLQINNCSIKELPRNLPRLTSLHMSNNNLNHIFYIKSLGYATPNEKSFYLDNNQIKHIPRQIKRVQNIAFLYLDHNSIPALHPNFFNIKALRYLCISNNHFTNDNLKKYSDIFMTQNPKLKLC